MVKKIISRCPICNEELTISRLSCGACQTQIDTLLPIPAFFRLPEDLQEFVMVFLRCRGNIKEAEKELGISYPTVCKRLDLVNELLGNQPVGISRHEILEKLERGDITAQEAAQLLKGR
jgi:hypothetical protein